MMKKLALCVAFVAGSAVLASAIGCDGNGNSTGSDMAMSQGTGDMAMAGSNADMAFACVTNPTMGNDFLNSCAPASVDFVDIQPFYPTLAPGGQLPSLQ